MTMEIGEVTLDPLPGVAVTVEHNKNYEWLPGNPVRGTTGKVVSRPSVIVYSKPIYTSYGEGNSIVTSEALDDSNHSENMESFTNKLNNARRIYLHSADWCPHCKTMKPIWDQVKAATVNSGIEYYEIDEVVAKTPGLNGIPTIRMLDEYGMRSEYPGGPNYEELRRWIVSPK